MTLSARKSNIKREGNAQSRIWVRTCPFKSCQPESNRGKECSGALTKPDAPAYSPFAHMLLAALSHSSSSYLTPQMEPRTGQTPSTACLKYIIFFINHLLMWSGSSPPVCDPISLSCLLLYLPVLMLGRPFPHPLPPHNPPSGQWQTDVCTHTGKTSTWDYSTPSPVHPLQIALPVPRINAP